MTRKLALGALAVALVAGLAAGWWLLRPGASASSTVLPAVTIECSGATGIGPEACRAWGDAILAEDAAPMTFEREDVRRLRLDRELLGLGGACRVEYFLSRYPDRPVWTDDVPCR